MNQQELIAALRERGINATPTQLHKLVLSGVITATKKGRKWNYAGIAGNAAEYEKHFNPARYWQNRAKAAEDLVAMYEAMKAVESMPPDEIEADEETAATVFEMADKLVELRAFGDDLKDQSKENNAAIESLELKLYEAMQAEGLKNFTRDGKSFSTRRQLWASPIGECKESVIEILEADEETAGMVSKSVNAQTFAAWVRNDLVGDVDEALEDQSALADLGEDAESLTEQDKEKIILCMKLPEHLRDLVNVALRRQIQIRKASKK